MDIKITSLSRQDDAESNGSSTGEGKRGIMVVSNAMVVSFKRKGSRVQQEGQRGKHR